MKKVITMVLVIAVLLGVLAGCSNEGTYGGTDTGTPVQEQASSFNTGRRINIISREDGSGTRGAFIELFGIEEKGADGSRKDMTTKEAVIANKTDIMLANVETDIYAIGYVSMGSLNEKIRAVEIDGAAPTTQNVKNGTYKISRPFNIATKGEADGLARDFIDFILSAEGQAVVANGYIPINDGAAAYSGSRPGGKIVVAGSSSVTPVMEKLKEAYLAINPGATIEIQMSDSTSGMTGTIDGTCDIGMASRDLKESETAVLTGIEIALDGIAVIVNKGNAVSGLTKEQVKAIFTGGAESWADVVK